MAKHTTRNLCGFLHVPKSELKKSLPDVGVDDECVELACDRFFDECVACVSSKQPRSEKEFQLLTSMKH